MRISRREKKKLKKQYAKDMVLKVKDLVCFYHSSGVYVTFKPYRQLNKY